jgi:hypothetical protein
LIFYSSLGHPTVAFNKKVLKGYINGDNFYSEKYKHAEDYELWTRLIFRWKFGNMPMSQLYYRIHGIQISNLNYKEQNEITSIIKRNYLKKLFPKFNNIDKLVFFFSNSYLKKYSYVSFLKSFFALILINYREKQFPFYFFFGKLVKIMFRNIYARKS